MRTVPAAKNGSDRAGARQQKSNRRAAERPTAGQAEAGGRQPGAAGQVLQLQHLVGNHAVERLLRSLGQPARGPGGVVQRWGGDEHYEIGQVTGLQIDLGNGVVLDWGEVVGLGGDEFDTPEEILELAKTESGRARIRAALESEDIAGSGARTLPAPMEDEKAAQKAKYYTLLLDNLNHFQSGGHGLDSYSSYHVKALNAAAAAGLDHPDDDAADLNAAYLQEAFGQHYLTDMFSAGHIITPRSEIQDYYVNEWAPKMVDAIIANLKRRLADGIFEQVAAQNALAIMAPKQAMATINSTLDGLIKKALDKLQGGKAELTTTLGKGVAGVISGAIHDYYNVKGVQVSSKNHPDTWVAYGDGNLGKADNQTNKEQAQLAVQAGLADLRTALEIGQREGRLRNRLRKPITIPDRVYFQFASAAVEGKAVEAVDDAAAFLAYRPDITLELTGHTDPLGKGPFNMDLGQKRADAAAQKIAEHAVDPARIATGTKGKTALVTTNPRKYNLNRRVEFHWKFPGAPFVLYDDNATAMQRIADAVAREIGPPFPNVEKFIPNVEPALNEPVPNWRWEAQSSRTLEMIDAWVSKRFTQSLKEQILNNPELAERTVDGMIIEPKPIVAAWLAEINESPTRFLASIFIDMNKTQVYQIPDNLRFP